jgi:ribonuclease HI
MTCPNCNIDIYVDGSADNTNKKAPSYTAVFIQGRSTWINPCSAVTNNEAEYMAVIEGIAMAKVARLRGVVTIISDSQLVVNQLNLEWKCREDRLLDLRSKALGEAASDPDLKFKYRWRRREHNQAGIELEKFIKKQRSKK